MKIVIPTYMRESPERQKAYYNLPESIREKIVVTTHSGRGEELQKANPTMNVHEFEGDLHIPKMRQAVMDLDEKVFMIDDQCLFWKRDYQEEGKVKHIKLSTPEEYEQMFEEVEKELDNYFWVGMSPKSSNTLHKEVSRSEITRSYSCYGLNRDTITNAGVRFTGLEEKADDAKLLEDFYVLLAMFQAGHKNVVLHNWVFDHKHGTGGGNSVNRNNVTQDVSQRELIKAFPEFVTQYEKENASWVAEEGSTNRTELRVQWKKAYSDPESGSLEGFFG